MRLGKVIGIFLAVVVCATGCRSTGSQSQTKIVHGTLDEDQSYPFVGAVLVSDPKGTLDHYYGGSRRGKSRILCTGTLVCEAVVLTAAHCVPSYWEDLAKFHFSSQFDVFADPYPREVSRFWVDPRFDKKDRTTHLHDVALLRLATSTHTHPIGQPLASFAKSDFANEGALGKVVGFGMSTETTPPDGKRRIGFMEFSGMEGGLLLFGVGPSRQKTWRMDSGAPLINAQDDASVIAVTRGARSGKFAFAPVETNDLLRGKLDDWCADD